MKNLFSTILLFVITLSFCQNIKSKGNLGVYLDNAQENEYNAIFSVKDISPNSTAADLGLTKGDLLISLNDNPITSYEHLKGMISQFYEGDKIKAKILRNNKLLKLKGNIKPKPKVVVSPLSETLYGEVPFEDGFIRSIINKPKGKGPFKTVFYIQGYPCHSINFQVQHPTMQMIKGLVENNYLVYRIEKPGVGDHYNCKPCKQLTFNEEVNAFLNAYDDLKNNAFVDKTNIFLFGHSLGGNVAPIIGNKRQPKGIITYGTLVKPWQDYLIDMARYTTPMLDNSFAEVESNVDVLKQINKKIYSSGSLQSLTEKEKTVLKYLNSFDGKNAIFDRDFSFWKAFNDISFSKEWSSIKTNVLSLYGESDVHSISAVDAQHIANIVNANEEGMAEFKSIPHMDHYFAKADSRNTSAKLISSGKIGQHIYSNFNPAIIEIVLEWINSLDKNRIPKLLKTSDSKLDLALTKMSTMDAVFEDLDNDGVNEIIIATEFGPNRILTKTESKYTQHQKSILKPITNYQYPYLGEDSEDIAIADFNKDGYKDLFFVSEDSKNHELYLNKGDNTFELSNFQIPKIGDANAVLVFDFNKDNYPDILIGIRGKNELYLNQQGKGFKNETTSFWVDNEDHTQDLIAVDVDNDGDLDIVEGIELGGSNIYIQTNAKFKEESERMPDMSQIETRKVIHVDIDEDGDYDLFFCNVGWSGKDPQNKLFLNDGMGNFSDITSTTLPIDNHTTLDVVFYDFNKDGKVDFLTHGINNAQNLKLFINTSTDSELRFEEHPDLLPKIYSEGVTIAKNTLNSTTEIYLGNHKSQDNLLILNE